MVLNSSKLIGSDNLKVVTNYQDAGEDQVVYHGQINIKTGKKHGYGIQLWKNTQDYNELRKPNSNKAKYEGYFKDNYR